MRESVRICRRKTGQVTENASRIFGTRLARNRCKTITVVVSIARKTTLPQRRRLYGRHSRRATSDRSRTNVCTGRRVSIIICSPPSPLVLLFRELDATLGYATTTPATRTIAIYISNVYTLFVRKRRDCTDITSFDPAHGRVRSSKKVNNNAAVRLITCPRYPVNAEDVLTRTDGRRT